MTKAQAIFLDHFARLGIFSKVLQLAGGQENGTMAKAVHTEPDKTPDIDPNTEDVREILQVTKFIDLWTLIKLWNR
jgi:hypothetical protein